MADRAMSFQVASPAPPLSAITCPLSACLDHSERKTVQSAAWS